MSKIYLLFLSMLLIPALLRAQPLVKITGKLTDENKHPLPKVTVMVVGQSQSTLTDENGNYTIYSITTAFTLKYNLLGYKTVMLQVEHEQAGRVVQDVVLEASVSELEQVTITTRQNQLSNSITLNIADVSSMPSASGNFETLIKTLPGVSVNNELSAQYSVRGGNFDENLVYINDIEINRPVLIRNGQQEGLSSINSELLSSAKFSAGGFEARYGDKLSSVLDLKYGRPDSTQATLIAGLTGASFSTKILYENSYLLAGMRYKNNNSVLSGQDTRGSYTPSFGDAQLIYHHNISSKFSLNFLGNFNSGLFKLVPENRQTEFGTLNKTLRLNLSYDGEEQDDYQTAGAAVTAVYTPVSNLVLRWINSYFNTLERERIDIAASYDLDELSNNIGVTDGIPQNSGSGGTGRYISYAHNNLTSNVFASEIKADQTFNSHTFSWGLRFEHKKYNDNLYEYSQVDSAGYFVNKGLGGFYEGYQINAQNKLAIQYFTAYTQDSYSLSPRTDLQLGVRGNFNTFSRQLLISPRLLLAYRPASNNRIFRFSAGIYQQAPDYRSLRDFQGLLNLGQKAQRSYNTSGGLDYAFDGLGTRLKFSTELYFKYQDRLIPYMMDNVRIKYLANQLATGYTMGADFGVGGEFVKDLISYFRVSLMNARQDIRGDNEGYMKRPTDQRINFSAFFQDRLQNSPGYKVHLNLLYGSKLPVGAPLLNRYSDSFNIPAYKRIDIGFSKDFLDDSSLRKPAFLDKNFSSFALFVEIFNLLNINNTVSYLWLRDIDNVQYAVPNYLTGRQLNFKLIIKFKNSHH
ncbi:hypothetical protein PBAL39_00952 [Pedobacter sp. BAL39]|uniref:TonB-dependent receptor n=1 Tax=Pedobacter sp. BAL39 TaxID=391596 RepID=UPI0001559FB8|nr:TonB-dependent receptor [Pedobacter sp. BAL39]EDM38139.1 hypothetical protein PBAL39_00952 [Pedobacter sp. BAL39]